MNANFVARDICPACAREGGLEVYRQPYADESLRDYLAEFYGAQGTPDLSRLECQDFVLRRCGACGLIFQAEIPGPDFMVEIYEKWIDPRITLERREKQRSLGYFTHLSTEALRFLRLFDRPPAELVILDYSMGWGHWCRAASAFGCTVHGSEYSASRVAYAREHGATVVDADQLEAGRYDAINAEQVFEHLPDPRQTLQRLSVALAPHGWLRLAVPDGRDAMQLLRDPDWSAPRGTHRSMVSVAPLEHINCFGRESLEAMARDSGLHPASAPPECRYVIVPNSVLGLIKACLRPAWHAVRRSPSRQIEMYFRHTGSVTPPRGPS